MSQKRNSTDKSQRIWTGRIRNNRHINSSKRTDVRLHYLNPVLDELFLTLNKLTNLNICPEINIDDDYSSIFELVDKINYEQSLAVKEPEIAKSDYSLNKSLRPEDVASASGKRVW